MKVRIGLKAVIIIIFLVIFFSSSFVLSRYYTRQHEELGRAFSSLRNIITKPDSVLLESLRGDISETLAGIRLIQSETRVYSSVMLFFIFSISCLIFIFLIVKLTKPLQDLQKASQNIKNGDYNVYIKPAGIKEMRDLAKSFNEMSKELENTQQKLLISQKQMIWKDVARILTHEIKNPLTPILLTMQRMEDKYHSDREKFDAIFQDSLQLVYQEINNLQNLVVSFSTFAKDVTLNPAVFDPAIAINEIIKPYMERYDVVLDLQENFRIKFDHTHFYQVITNIFQNAIESSDASATVFISVEKNHSHIVIKIRDQGAGIPVEDLSRIFEPYFTQKSKGTGIGLALVKKLCEANQCFVRVKSVLGEGTIFELLMEDVREMSNG